MAAAIWRTVEVGAIFIASYDFTRRSFPNPRAARPRARKGTRTLTHSLRQRNRVLPRFHCRAEHHLDHHRSANPRSSGKPITPGTSLAQESKPRHYREWIDLAPAIIRQPRSAIQPHRGARYPHARLGQPRHHRRRRPETAGQPGRYAELDCDAGDQSDEEDGYQGRADGC